MPTTITKGASVITPVAVTGWASTRQTGNILHTVLGRTDMDVTYKAAGLRTLTLTFLFRTLAQALACETMHASVGTITLADTDNPALGMKYVPSGSIALEINDTRKHWTVAVEVQEVL